MWRNKRRTASKISSRLSRMSTQDLIGWSDSALFTAGSGLTQWSRDGDERHLLDVEQAAEVLLETARELIQRGR